MLKDERNTARPGPGRITRLLKAARARDDRTVDDLFRRTFPALRRLARSLLDSENPNHTLQPTLLADEAFFRLIMKERHHWKDRAAFFNLALRRMRQTLETYRLEHKATPARSTSPREPLGQVARTEAVEEVNPEFFVIVDDLLLRLAEWDARAAQVAEFVLFGGLEQEEIARLLGLSVRTVRNDWLFARAWIAARLSPEWTAPHFKATA